MLPKLRELDLRQCGITDLHENTFKNVTNLVKLFLSKNNIVQIPSTIFDYLTSLKHLDLSYNNSTRGITGYRSNDIYLSVVGGLLLSDYVFSNLTELRVLDLSHSKISVTSARSINFLGPKLEQLSLCHSGIQIIAPRMFSNTNLKVLDISGNPSIASTMERDIFDGLENKLEILFFKYSNVKWLGFLDYLENLVILCLKGNTINQLTVETFEKNINLEVLDLSSNHISNWYTRAFENNKKLKILNVRDNNINIMTNEMTNDFNEIQFLAIGNNNFICSCILRKFLDRASENNCNVQCSVEHSEFDKSNSINSNRISIMDTSSQIYDSYFSNMKISYHNMRQTNKKSVAYENYDVYNHLNEYNSTSALREAHVRISTKHVDLVCNRSQQIQNCEYNSSLYASIDYSNTFQLIDFNDNDYKCINSTTNELYRLQDIEECLEYRNWPEEDVIHRSKFVITLIIISVVLLILYLICYYKWWYIRYFFILFKNATILSFLDKEKELLQNQDCNDLPYNYDVFVSYCDENRDWVLQQFLPNIEEDQEINVCLHERDFQVGLSILENIIYCMDRSRALLLIVSERFLLSHWCQFEMHLAQYR